MNFIEKTGSSIAHDLGQMLVEKVNANEALKEQYLAEGLFLEDNSMSNSSDLYTVQLANFIYYASYAKFEKYFNAVFTITPSDIGMPDGAGTYKIPKIYSGVSQKFDNSADSTPVTYANNLKSSVTLSTDTYQVGTKITRRLIKRGAKGFIEKLMKAASDAALRGICKDIANTLVGASTLTPIATGASYANIQQAFKDITTQTNTAGELYGFEANMIALSSEGRRVLFTSSDYKLFAQYNNNAPGAGELKAAYDSIDGAEVVVMELMTATKDSKTSHAVVYDKNNYLVFLKETEMETYDGRIPGTTDEEIIHAIDAGIAPLNTTAGIVITAA